MQHEDKVMNVNFSPDGTQLLAAGLGQGAFLWDVPSFPLEKSTSENLDASIRLWTGLESDSEGNVRELTVEEVDKLRQDLAGKDPLTIFQSQ